LRIDFDLVAFGDGVDQLELEGLALVAEQLLGCLAVDHLAGEGRVAGDDLAHLGLDLGEIVGREGLRAREVVIEAVLDHRADRHLRAGIELLHGFGHDVGRVVTDEFERFGVVARQDADARVGLDRLGEIAGLAVELDRHRLLGERLRDGLGNVAPRHAGLEGAGRTIGKCQGDLRHRLAPLTPAYRCR
jgi:hypothetical protein